MDVSEDLRETAEKVGEHVRRRIRREEDREFVLEEVDYTAELEAPEQAFAKFGPLGTVTVAHGPTRIGKTTLLVSTALSIASGNEFLGPRTVFEKLPVVYLFLEDNASHFNAMVQAGVKQHRLVPAQMARFSFLAQRTDTEDETTFVIAKLDNDGNVLITPMVDKLLAALKARGPRGVLFVDPGTLSYDLDMMDQSHIKHMIRTWCQIARRSGWCVVIGGHDRKGATGSVEDVFGSATQGWYARAVIALRPMSAEEAKLWKIEPDEADEYFCIPEKSEQTYFRHGGTMWFHIVEVPLRGRNRRGEIVDMSAQTLEPYEPPKAELTDLQICDVLEVLNSGEHTIGSQGSKWAGKLLKAQGLSHQMAINVLKAWEHKMHWIGREIRNKVNHVTVDFQTLQKYRDIRTRCSAEEL